LLDPRHEMFDVFRSRNLDGFLNLIAVGPLILVPEERIQYDGEDKKKEKEEEKNLKSNGGKTRKFNPLWSCRHHWTFLGSAELGDGSIKHVDLVEEIDG
jgi:hypothetical protein